jgi:hypothetical protein
MRAVQNGAAEGIDIARVTPDQQRCNDGIERGFRRGDRGVPEGFTLTDQTVIGLDLHHENFKMVPGLARERRMRAAHVEGKRDNKAFDGGDQHAEPREKNKYRTPSPLAARFATAGTGKSAEHGRTHHRCVRCALVAALTFCIPFVGKAQMVDMQIRN